MISFYLYKLLILKDFYTNFGGEGGIRTLDTFPYTHFPGVRLRPLGHLTSFSDLNTYEHLNNLELNLLPINSKNRTSSKVSASPRRNV